jgi:hypothetical protein
MPEAFTGLPEYRTKVEGALRGAIDHAFGNIDAARAANPGKDLVALITIDRGYVHGQFSMREGIAETFERGGEYEHAAILRGASPDCPLTVVVAYPAVNLYLVQHGRRGGSRSERDLRRFCDKAVKRTAKAATK